MLRYGIFQLELAIYEFDWTFSTRRNSYERIAYQHHFGPPSFYRFHPGHAYIIHFQIIR